MIKTVDLYKEYERVIAVKNVNFEVQKNSIFALIGPNGAGKTTLIKMIATLLEPTKGQIFVDGIENLEQRKEARAKLGFLPDIFHLYDDLKVKEYLEYFCLAYNIPRPEHEARIKRAINLVNLEVKTDEFISDLSRGMKQRVGIAKTLIHEPSILLLDEPASGLDPKARIELRNILKLLQEEGKTLVVSSHILSELSDFCDSFGIMEKGVMVKNGKLHDIEFEDKKREVKIQVVRNLEQTETLLKEIESITDLFIKDEIITFNFSGDLEELSEINTFLVNKGIKIIAFYERKKNIEDLFMKYSNNQVS
ncbi:MAG: ABC transporter ATP-binding protein [Candidatus Sericytochromatia bacterium]